jgi:NTP pyrophosphatase (non-canonical NTP hydrolase)
MTNKDPELLPTDAMIEAGQRSIPFEAHPSLIRNIWNAMERERPTTASTIPTDGELNELVVKLTEHAVMELDADEENTLQIEAWGNAAEKEIRAFLAALSTIPSAGELRPEVLAFAHLMERELQANDHKPGWKDDSPLDITKRVEEETGELYRAVIELERQVVWSDDFEGYGTRRGNGWSRKNPITGKRQVGTGYAPMEGDERRSQLARVASECADVANMAMMVADVCGQLPAALSIQTISGKRMREALELLDKHIHRCRVAVTECPNWSPAQAEWSRARDALLNFRDELVDQGERG